MSKIFISAGEPSGDKHAGRLLKQMKKIKPEIEFVGIGGMYCEEVGLQSIVPLSLISVVGFWEVAKKFSFFMKILAAAKKIIAGDDVQTVILIDYPGFNLKLAEYAKSLGKKVIYYIAPQLWAWGQSRTKKLKNSVSQLIVAFPFEVEFFAKFGIETHWFGHPLLDNEIFDLPFESIENRKPLLALLPGSRKQEIHRHIPLFLNIIKLIKNDFPDLEIGIAAASVDLKNELTGNPEIRNLNCRIYENSLQLMLQSRAGIVKTGTSTLEATLCGMPFVMVYKTSAITNFFGKHLIKLENISLTNILAKKKVVQELIQNEASPELISKEIKKMLSNQNYALEMQNEFKKIRKSLGEKGASVRAAEFIASQL
ncbi:MAG: Lipid-A-disaccharide synthase [Ignavibacteria bacterium]|nr:Lipid-A-disaccharide synthase [Ignavibacteria bacterium]